MNIFLKDHDQNFDQSAKARVGGIEIKGLSFIADAVKLATRVLDKEIIERVLVNLYTNAVKYAKELILITTNIVENKFMYFDIFNDGPQIPKEYHETIFEKYSQVDPKNLGISKSTGIACIAHWKSLKCSM